MTFDWQNIAALAIVGLAGGYLVRASMQAIGRRAKPGCGQGCGHCPGSTPSETGGLVTLDASKVTRRD